MNKFFSYILSFSFMLSLTTNIFAKNIQGSGVVKKEKRNISGAKYIVNDSPAKVIVKVGNDEELIVEADDNIINLINTYTKNNYLTVSTADVSFNTRQPIIVYITTKELNGLKVKSSGDIVSSGKIQSNKMTLLVEGSGNIQIANLLTDLLTLAIMNSGDIKLAGQTRELTAEIKSSGDVDAKMMKSLISNIILSGTGDCSTYCTEQAMIKITGNGDVRLYGKPPVVKQYITGNGVIRSY